MRPDAMVGWPRAVHREERPFLAPAQRDLPEVGLLTGRGDTANVEVVLNLRPDLILDFGSVARRSSRSPTTCRAGPGFPMR
jgi:iron complex transport system substrate-binding protein